MNKRYSLGIICLVSIVILSTLASATVGVWEETRIRKVSYFDPMMYEIQMSATLGKEHCSGWSYGEYTYTGGEVLSWSLRKDKQTNTVSLRDTKCEIVSTNGNTIEFRCRLVNDEYCDTEYFTANVGNWLFATIEPQGDCFVRDSPTWAVHYPNQELFCEDNKLMNCDDGIIVEVKDCSLTDDSCYKGECRVGCPIEGEAYRAAIGNTKCIDGVTRICNENKLWETFQECSFGCAANGRKCSTIIGIGTVTCKLMTHKGSAMYDSRELTKGMYCIDGSNTLGYNYNDNRETATSPIPDFEEGIYECVDGAWQFIVGCDTKECSSELACKTQTNSVKSAPEIIQASQISNLIPIPPTPPISNVFQMILSWIMNLIS